MRARLLCTLFILTFAFGCKDASDEDILKGKVRAAIAAVDEKKASDVVEDAAEDFKGPRNIDLRETRRFITGYMLGNGWLRAFERKLEVEVDGDKATVMLEAVLAQGQQIKTIEDVLPTNGSVVRFDVQAEKRDGEWKWVKGDYKQLRW